MGSRSSPSPLAGLLLGVTLFGQVAGQSGPAFNSTPAVDSLVEGRPWTLKCTFRRTALDFDIVVGTFRKFLVGSTVQVDELNTNAIRTFVSDTQVEYTIQTMPTRTLNDVLISCGQKLSLNGNSFNITRTVVVKYGPLRNVSESTVDCVNITAVSGEQSVHLNASRIFEDPGNPASTVEWMWENRSQAITVGTSGAFGGILSQKVIRADHNHVILAQYRNAFGSTMQRFFLCVNSVPGVPTSVTCSRIVNGYNCSWSPSADDGGYRITHYNVGHQEGTDKPQDLPMTVLSSTTSHLINTLQAGVVYTFAVSAVNVLGSGPSGSDNVITPRRPEVALNIVVVGQSRFSIQATWGPPPNQDVDFPVTDYEISLYDMTSSPALRKETTNGERAKTFDGLKADTTYWIGVSARNAVGFGSLSDLVNGTTLPEGTVGVVSNVLSSEVVDTSFSVQWVAADAGGSDFEIKRYKVDVLKDGKLVNSVVVGGDQTRAEIDGLKANTTYEVQIFADNGKGYGNPSVILTVRTKEAKEDESGDQNLGLIIGIIGVTAVIVIVVVIVYYRLKKNQDEIKEDASSKGTKTKSTVDQMTQSNAYELSGQADYAEVRPAEKRETLISNPAYSTASNR